MKWTVRSLAFSLIFCLCLFCVSGEDHVSNVYHAHENAGMKIALTFDDGPDKRNTDEILDILNEYGIKATFFVIGKNCEENPEIIKRIASEGHEIGNHTYSHPRLCKISLSKLKKEIMKTEKIVYDITGVKTCLFRPPEGVYSNTIAEACEALGYRAILWSVDTTDWRSPKADRIAQVVLDNTSSGVIILCHDYIAGKSNTPAALRIFIPQLIQQGYIFVTVSELICL